MELAEKPPLLSPPPAPDRGDNDHARFLMTVPLDIRKEVRPPEDMAIPPEEYEDYVGNCAETLQKVWKRRGLNLLGCQISHIACNCGKNCPGSQWGVVIPKRTEELMALIQYAMVAGAENLEQVEDPTIKVGVFTVEYRDGVVL